MSDKELNSVIESTTKALDDAHQLRMRLLEESKYYRNKDILDMLYSDKHLSFINPTTGKEEIIVKKSKFMAVTDFIYNMCVLGGIIALAIILL